VIEPAATPAPGLHRVEQIMGTAVGADILDPGVRTATLDAAFAWFREVDARFSTYREDSEIRRIDRGELAQDGASPDVRWILARCDELAIETRGAFDARHHRPDGGLDPSGIVKGWSVEEAARLVEIVGGRNFSLSAGGDLVLRGERVPGRPWRVGIRHPDRADRVAAVLAVRDLAVATSGLYERGAHILDPRTGLAPSELKSATVVGPSLTWADAYATTLMVMGQAGLEWVAGHKGYDALVITADDRVLWTPGMDGVLA
jgi:thiamine biosynthesis lipoprotein